MAKKKFDNMHLLEKIQYLVKQELPDNTQLETKKVTVEYTLTTLVNDTGNSFEFINKEFNVVVTLEDEELDIKVLDGNKQVLESNCSLTNN